MTDSECRCHILNCPVKSALRFKLKFPGKIGSINITSPKTFLKGRVKGFFSQIKVLGPFTFLFCLYR